MSKTANNLNHASLYLLVIVSAIFILFLTTLNIQKYLEPRKVLGLKTEVVNQNLFWYEFLEKNPDYIPGWVEIGRYDKAKEIDPNYF